MLRHSSFQFGVPANGHGSALATPRVTLEEHIGRHQAAVAAAAGRLSGAASPGLDHR